MSTSGRQLYVASVSTNEIFTCQISESGSLSNCNVSVQNVGLNQPNGLAVNSASNKLYILNFVENRIFGCDITFSNGALNNCMPIIQPDNLDGANKIALN